jgi:heme-degrading monooxygenase HmoA
MKKHYMVVCHKVKDYAQWKRAFDKYIESFSRKYGLGEVHVCRNADDANEIILSTEVEDIARAREFAKSSELKEAMKEAGVTKETGIWFLDELFQVSSLVAADMYDAELG